jgi:flagellar hook assembly protein FlgD
LLVAVNGSGLVLESRRDNDSAIVVVNTTTVGVSGSAQMASLRVSPAFPNPMRMGAVVELTLPNAAQVDLTLYDVAGRKVRTLVAGPMQPGAHRVAWDGRDGNGTVVKAGVYFYEMRVDHWRAARRVVVLR